MCFFVYCRLIDAKSLILNLIDVKKGLINKVIFPFYFKAIQAISCARNDSSDNVGGKDATDVDPEIQGEDEPKVFRWIDEIKCKTCISVMKKVQKENIQR